MTISIASQKGGTGKTTTSITLASAIARKGYRTLLVDLDSQANSSKVLIRNYKDNVPVEKSVYTSILQRHPLPIHPTEVPNLEITPSHILLSETDMELTSAKDHREARLKSQLEKVEDNYDYVIIDCPPALSWLTINAFTASNRAIIVIAPGYFELDSVVQINKTISEVKEYFNPDLEIWGYLFTKSEPTVNSKISLQILRQTYTDKVFKTIIPKNTDISDAHYKKTDIFDYKPDAKSAMAYKKFLKELGI